MSVPSSVSGARTSRRTLMKGAAWAVPAVTVTAPALAASMSSCISSEVADDIEKIFAAYKANPPSTRVRTLWLAPCWRAGWQPPVVLLVN